MTVRKIKPPFIGKGLLSFFLNYRHPETVLADFEEVYHDIAQTRGVFTARLWYWLQVVLTIPTFVNNSFYWSIAMFENYLKIALRNIKKHKVYSLINVVGLSIGLVAVIFLLLYVQFEISFDRFHDKADRIYRVMKSGIGSSGMSPSMPAPLAPAMEEEFPEIEQVTRFSFRNNVHISANDKNLFENGFVFTDPATFEIFSFEFLRGSSNTALVDPSSILLSESMAVKYFGNEDPVGRTITYKGMHDFKVTGVLKDLPENSTFTLNFIVPFKTLEKMSRFYDLSSWGAFSYQTYFLLDRETDPRDLEKKFPALIEKHLNKEIAQQVLIRFQTLRNIHMDSRRIVITLFTSIAGLILIIACINYINLATARSAQRMKEIGIRKVVGANRTQLVRQFLGESVIFTLLAFLLAALLVSIFLPSFSTFVGRKLNFNLLENREFLFWLVALIVFVGLFAGSYPALAISSRKPTHIIRGQVVSSKGLTLRNILVIFQFIVSILLIVATLVIKGQLHYIRTRDMGFRKDRILVVDIRDQRLRKNRRTLQNELKRNPNIHSVSASAFLPNFTDIATTISWPGKPEDREQMIYLNFVDYDFIDLYGIGIVEGRNFSRGFPTDTDGTFLLNETAVKAIGWESALGKEFSHHIGGRTGKVIGVVKDFHMNPLHQAIEPLCIDLNPRMADSHLSVQITGNQIPETVSFIQETLAKFAPGYPFVYQHFEDIFGQAYAFEQKLDTIFSLFSLLAIIVACLGLLGLASFAAQQRMKEIGIRKVLGASVSGIVLLLSKQFTKWVLIANIVAWPMAYFAMHRSLQLYAYRIRLGPGFFLLAGGFALFVALMTVSTQAFRAARANSVDSLRYE